MTILDFDPETKQQTAQRVVESLRLSLLLRQDGCVRIIWKIRRTAARVALVVQIQTLLLVGGASTGSRQTGTTVRNPQKVECETSDPSGHFARVQALGLSRSPWVSFATAGELMLHLPFFGQCTSQKGKTRNSRPNIFQVSKGRIRDFQAAGAKLLLE